MRIDLASGSSAALLKLLAKHPFVSNVEHGSEPGLTFLVAGKTRRIEVGSPDLEVTGLPELMDNNPMVCADQISVPDPASTLLLICLGPLAEAGLIAEPPQASLSAPFDSHLAHAFLSREGWTGGIQANVFPTRDPAVYEAIVEVKITQPSDEGQLNELYAERFARSFFVEQDQASGWQPSLVKGKPFAAYRLAWDEPSATLTVRAMADREGKCGAAQVVHAMNIMVGYEETAGLEG